MKKFPYDDDGGPFDEGPNNSEHYEALSVFCNRYAPANEQTMTDMFSTKEIQKLVLDHVGVEVNLNEIAELLIQMNYSYKLDENNFMWMVKKEN